ncbi:MAG TPA: glycosyltransferase family 4 protein [Planctomycetota bacterium]|nr:glycosyltransferase family 4 protein [Planctomycetota bacterium]
MTYRFLYHHRIRAEDGQAVHVREMIGALRQSGHEVRECALVPKTTAGPAGSRRPGFWQRLRLPRACVEVLEVLYNRRGRSMLLEAARGFRPHFVYERHALHCRAGLDVARALGVPLLLEVNSPMVTEMQRLGSLRLAARAAATEREVLGRADAVLAVTRVLADLLAASGARPERLHVIGNGADPSRYGDVAREAALAVRARWQLPAGGVAVGFVGHMRPWHNLELMLDAMTRPALQALVFVLIGNGPALSPVLARARELGLQDRVRTLGDVPPALLAAHVLACDGALIPAINEYASPLKLFDALAAGVPVLAPDQPNLREYLKHGETALLFRPGDSGDLAQQLHRLVHESGLARALGQAGRRTLLQQRWTWAGNAERVLAVCARLEGRGAR